MNMDLQFLHNWLITNRLTLNILKTKYIASGVRVKNSDSKTRTCSFHKQNFAKKSKCSKCLDVEIDEFLTWDAHITSVFENYHLVWEP